ncbi:MAG: ImmA/IrrE family metallo-endopeptidase [Rhodobacteraceae bacterium]|nr:ImmA/IrrE family metallo-endopeptidase [Paracoccaceae bacterium]
MNFFRKVGADTKRRNMSCDVHAKWLASTGYSFDGLVNFPSVDIPSFEPKDEGENIYSDEEIEHIAESVREHFGLGLGPISNVVRLMEKFGVVVCWLEMKDEKVRAFWVWSGAKPFVFLASDKASGARVRFDAAHELGHLVLHRWVGSDEIEEKARLQVIEKEANQSASDFLLPRKSFPNEVFSSRLASFLDLKTRWKVSMQAMVFRCKTIGIFDEQQITNLNKQIYYKKWPTREPMDGPEGILIEQPLLLGKIARLVFDNSQMKQDEIVSRLGFSRSTIERLLGHETGSLSRPPERDFEPSLK